MSSYPAARMILSGRRIERIMAAASRMTGVSRAEILGPSRLRNIAWTRFAVAKAARLAGRSYPQIGLDLGKRDATTVINAVARADELARENPCYGTLCRMLGAVR